VRGGRELLARRTGPDLTHDLHSNGNAINNLRELERSPGLRGQIHLQGESIADAGDPDAVDFFDVGKLGNHLPLHSADFWQ
jgi:hypothetical protein